MNIKCPNRELLMWFTDFAVNKVLFCQVIGAPASRGALFFVTHGRLRWQVLAGQGPPYRSTPESAWVHPYARG